ncbi:MAG: hypothetical protein NXI21_05100 [Alphaproteobacteria bacterium]|nr:hypothetical protein [Alphaproteobacteria bacterium]
MKKLLIFGLLGLLLLGGGGGAYWWFMLRDAGEEAAEAEPPPQDPPVFLELDSLTIPVIRSGSIVKYVLLKITLEVEDQGARDEVVDRMPRLKDAFLRDLHDYFASIPLDSPVNVRTVKQRLQRVADRQAGPGVVKDVLIQGAFEKRS